MELTQKLLSFLNVDVIDVDPHQFLAFRLQCDGELVWTIEDGVMSTQVTGGSAANITLNLSDYSVATLAAFFAAQVGYTVPYADTSDFSQLSALVCMDGTADSAVTSNADHIYGYTTYVWSYTDANANELEQAEAQIANALAQMSTTSAQDVWLDFLGTFYKVPRNQGEADQTYAIRMIASVLLPSANNVGMALAIEFNWPGTSAVVTDAGTTAIGLLLRDGRILFNSAFVHNSNVGVVSNGFFDLTFAFDFSGPISITQYIPLLLAAVNQYRAAGTYIRTLVLKNGVSASVLVQSFNVGPILVNVFDQDINPFDYFTWADDEEPDADDRVMYQSSGPVGSDGAAPPFDNFEYSTEEPDEDDRMFDSAPVGIDAAGTPFPDEWDWSAEEPDQDDRLMVLDSAAINIDDAPLNPVADGWDWSAEEPDEDDRAFAMDSSSVAGDAQQQLPAGSDVEYLDEEITEFFTDHFGNNDGAPAAYGDAWDWDEEPAVTIHIDTYQNK